MVTKTVHKQIRGFVLIWVAITLIMIAATFLAIYFTSNEVWLRAGNPLPLTREAAPGEAPAALVLPSASPLPTYTPTPPPPTATVPVYQAEATDPPPPTATPSQTPEPTPLPVNSRAYEIGIQVEQSPDFNTINQDDWYRSVAQDLGLPWVKQQALWERMEPVQGEIDWRLLDFIVPSAQKFQLKLLLSIATAPAWAREPGANLERRGPPAEPQAFADFVAKVVERYPGAIHAIEVWNEQNIDSEWTSVHGLSADRYVALLRATYETVKRVDPGLILISGALSPTGLDDGVTVIDDFRYMDGMIEAGMLDWADCVGAAHNGYNISPDFRYDAIPEDPAAIFRGPYENPHHSWSFRSTLEGYANRVRAAGKDSSLCVTEFGWPTAEDLGGARPGFEFALDTSLAEQADWVPRAMSNMRDWGFVWLAFIWNFNYGPHADYAVANDSVPYSLIGPGFNFRPAYAAIKAWQAEHIANRDS